MPGVTLDKAALYMRTLLEQYKSKNISPEKKMHLIRAIEENYANLKTDAEKEYFEIIINRYLLTQPLSLLELAELYNKQDTSIGSWDIRKGIVLLSCYLPSTPHTPISVAERR